MKSSSTYSWNAKESMLSCFNGPTDWILRQNVMREPEVEAEYVSPETELLHGTRNSEVV
jgi:hypothetical protein